MPEVIPADVAVDVVIAQSAGHLGDWPAPFVAIFPDYNTWNDYTRNFFARLYIQPAGAPSLELGMRLMFKGRTRSSAVFDILLAEHGNVFPIEQVGIPFVSLLPEADYYRQAIQALGFELGVSALRKVHDAVVARTEGIDENLLALIDDEEFHIGALRTAAGFDALRRGSRFFRPSISETVDEAAADFVFTAKLPSADNEYTLPFVFHRGGLFRDRASVLIGRNGVGKTQLLRSIVDGLHGDHLDGFDQPAFEPALQASRVLVFSSVPTDPFPRSIGAWHGIDYEYFAVNASVEDRADSLLTALVACKKAEDRNLFGENRDKSRLDVIREALEPIDLWRRLHLPLRARKAGDDLPHVVEPGGLSYFPLHRALNELNLIRLLNQIDWGRSAVVLDDAMTPRRLSSGEYAMLRFAAQASAAIEQGSLLLLDEPETHLHPNFVSDLMEILDNLLQSTGSIAIIATHSPYIVREAPRERVSVLRLEEREVFVDTPRMQTFGASIDSISQFVFNDSSISHRYQKTLADWAEQTGRELGIEGVIEQYGEELNSESLSFIARKLAEPPAEAPEPEAM